MNSFTLNIPTKIYFGRKILESAIAKEKFEGNVLIVTTGRSLIKNGYIDELIALLNKKESVTNVSMFDGISANPKITEINKAIAVAKSCNAQVIIGFGGGSSIDAAKAVAAGTYSKHTIEDMFYKGIQPDESTLPIIAIPTTAGTGSELSKAAIITDDKKNVKGGVRGERLYPSVAIVDSYFTESVPFNVTMETGFDVLAHAVESYISVAASAFTRMLSIEAAKIVWSNLPLLADDLTNIEARSNMSYASMIMGINLGNASTCLPHRLQYPLGANSNTSHGAGLSALFPTWIKHEYKYSSEQLRELFKGMSGALPKSDEECANLIKEFQNKLQLPTSLKEINISEELLDKMANEVSGNIKNDPLSAEDEIINTIYHESF